MSLSTREVAELGLLLRAVARAEIMPRFRRLGEGQIRTKTGPMDLVTEADEAAEQMITKGLTRMFPGCAVIGEEAASADPGLLGRIAGADLAFVVDPIDGTANYCAGVPVFGSMVAAVVRGAVAASVIHDPVLDDTASALRGEGAWLDAADGTRRDLRVAAGAAVGNMGGCVSWRYMPAGLQATACRNLPKFGSVWDHRCAAAQYRMVADGSCHFLAFHRTLPWDHAPGWLLHREAGGWSARLDGTEYDASKLSGGLVCAPDRESWHAVVSALLEGGG